MISRLHFICHYLSISESDIKELWKKLKNEDPSLLRVFENFVENVSQEIKRSKSDFTILESALQKFEKYKLPLTDLKFYFKSFKQIDSL